MSRKDWLNDGAHSGFTEPLQASRLTLSSLCYDRRSRRVESACINTYTSGPPLLKICGLRRPALASATPPAQGVTSPSLLSRLATLLRPRRAPRRLLATRLIAAAKLSRRDAAELRRCRLNISSELMFIDAYRPPLLDAFSIRLRRRRGPRQPRPSRHRPPEGGRAAHFGIARRPLSRFGRDRADIIDAPVGPDRDFRVSIMLAHVKRPRRRSERAPHYAIFAASAGLRPRLVALVELNAHAADSIATAY